jgi:CxxC-x17-CxxC domain-containing protein
MTEQRLANVKKTRVLSQIKCRDCGAVEFVGFVPEDPGTVLCRPCFSRQAKGQKEQRGSLANP